MESLFSHICILERCKKNRFAHFVQANVSVCVCVCVCVLFIKYLYDKKYSNIVILLHLR